MASQHGFLKNHTTNFTLIHLVDNVSQYLNKGRKTAVIVCDISKASPTFEKKNVVWI